MGIIVNMPELPEVEVTKRALIPHIEGHTIEKLEIRETRLRWPIRVDLLKKIENEIKEMVKEKFDYEISIADIKKAGITTTGAVGENQLPELLEAFTKYRKDNKLWDVKTNE